MILFVKTSKDRVGTPFMDKGTKAQETLRLLRSLSRTRLDPHVWPQSLCLNDCCVGLPSDPISLTKYHVRVEQDLVPQRTESVLTTGSEDERGTLLPVQVHSYQGHLLWIYRVDSSGVLADHFSQGLLTSATVLCAFWRSACFSDKSSLQASLHLLTFYKSHV